MEIYGGPLLLGRIIPILYFMIVIPGLIYILWLLVRWIIRSIIKEPFSALVVRQYISNMRDALDIRITYPDIRLFNLIFGAVILLSLFTFNFALGNLTARLVINNRFVSYTELRTSGRESYTIPIKDINWVCQSNEKSYLNGGNSYWVISGKNYEYDIDTTRIDHQDKILKSILRKRPDLSVYGKNLFSQYCYTTIENKNIIQGQ